MAFVALLGSTPLYHRKQVEQVRVSEAMKIWCRFCGTRWDTCLKNRFWLKSFSRSKDIRSRNSRMKLGGGAGGDAVAPLYQREQAGKSKCGAILELCKNKLMNDNRLLIEGTEWIPSTDSDAANRVLRVVMVMEASWPELESDHRLHMLPIVSTTIWMDLHAWIFISDLFADYLFAVQFRLCPFPKQRQAGAFCVAYGHCDEVAESVSSEYTTDRMEKKKRKMTSLLMWIIRCRREQLSDSHPPLHTQQPSHSISQMCVVCGHGRWQSLWPSLWAVVDALRFGAYRALRALCSQENSDDHAENVRNSSL